MYSMLLLSSISRCGSLLCRIVIIHVSNEFFHCNSTPHVVFCFVQNFHVANPNSYYLLSFSLIVDDDYKDENVSSDIVRYSIVSIARGALHFAS